MRTTLFILFVTISQVFALGSYSQNTRLSLNLKDATIKDVLKEIENKSEFYFMYDATKINVAQKVNITSSNMLVPEILDRLFQQTGITYKINNRLIALNSRSSSTESQQLLSVSGKVVDTSGSPLPGVTVVVKGTNWGTITDGEGIFSLSNVPTDATLIFSFVGMRTQEISVAGKSTINIVLKEEAIGIDEVVAVGYGTQRKGNLTGSISSVKSEKLTIAPIASTSNSLAGVLPGLVSKQTNGQPGSDAAFLSIRGFGNALVIVDGVESSFNNIDANQIESVSILKDGASSIYGARAGNGVILVTTKPGQDQKPSITFNTSTTFQGATAMLKPASSGQRSEMEREVWIQSGKPESTAPWTTEQIQKYYDGTDPLYPNTNWYKEVFRDWAPQQQHNVSVRGGSEKIKYYGFLGYTDQETMIKKGGGDYKRYNLQSNIDAKITNDLSLQLDLAANFEKSDFPIRGLTEGAWLWQDYWGTKPYYPAHLSDPTKVAWGGIDVGGIHVTSNKDISGYNKNDKQNLKGTISLNYNIKAVKGLSAKAFVNYIQTNSFNKQFTKPVKFYTEPSEGVFVQAGSYNSAANLSQGYWKSNILTTQYSLNYDNTFNEIHHLTAMAVYEAIDYYNESLSAYRDKFLTDAIDQMYAGSTTGMSNNGSASEMGRKSYVGRINYSYKSKYLIETIIRADASAKFSSSKRWGYFPSVSLGWVVSQEDFMKQFSALDILKLRASYGQSGNDAVGNFQYLSGYGYGATYILGSDPQQGLVSSGLANENLTWEKMAISNIGIDFSLYQRKLYGEADVFYRQRSGIPATRITTLPSTFGASLPQENINSLNNRGFELSLGTAGKLGEVSYDVSGNISWTRSKWDHYEEPEYSDPDQARINKRSGNWTDRNFGYVSDGLFTSQAEIDALEFTYEQGNNTLRPGDIRYMDINNDDKLDWKDQVDIGKGTTPHWMIGFNANIKYRNFDFSALFQGATGYNTWVKLSDASTLKYEVRWTEANNNPNALVPRLGGASSNDYTSDFYYKKAGYIRLKSASLGYNLPKRWLDKIGLSQVRIYSAGTNLLTFNRLKKYGIDPEAANVGWYYPQQRTISFGANISF